MSKLIITTPSLPHPPPGTHTHSLALMMTHGGALLLHSLLPMWLPSLLGTHEVHCMAQAALVWLGEYKCLQLTLVMTVCLQGPLLQRQGFSIMMVDMTHRCTPDQGLYIHIAHMKSNDTYVCALQSTSWKEVRTWLCMRWFSRTHSAQEGQSYIAVCRTTTNWLAFTVCI